MHQLFKNELNSIKDNNVFLESYLGKAIIERLKENQVACLNWPEQLKSAFINFVTFWAKEFPEADHVIRADCGKNIHPCSPEPGKLLMYFGLPRALPGVRSQYLCMNINNNNNDISFNLFVGGSAQKAEWRAISQNEDTDEKINGFTFSSVEEVNEATTSFKNLIAKQRAAIRQLKPWKDSGFCPSTCQNIWDKELTSEEAKAIFFEYWTQRKRELDKSTLAIEQAKFREHDRKRYYISIECILNGSPVSEAYEIGLNSTA